MHIYGDGYTNQYIMRTRPVLCLAIPMVKWQNCLINLFRVIHG